MVDCDGEKWHWRSCGCAEKGFFSGGRWGNSLRRSMGGEIKEIPAPLGRGDVIRPMESVLLHGEAIGSSILKFHHI